MGQTTVIKENQKSLWVKLSKASLIFLVILIVIAGIYHKRIFRLYKIITLFEPNVITENFRNIAEFIDYRYIRQIGPVFNFEQELKDLPQNYVYEGKEKNLSQFLEQTWTTGLIVVKDDKITFEKYYLGNTEKSLAMSWSVGKSFVSALIGIAIAEGHIKNINQAVTDYVPMLKDSGYNNVPIKDILQMSSGILFNEDYGDFNSDINRMGRAMAFGTSLDDFVMSLKSERKPGIFNHYVSMDTQVLGMLLRKSTGRTLSSYLEEKIWQKIGMESDAKWIIDGNGMEMAFGALNVVLRDYARFGRLFLNEGNWNGEQIVPQEWVKASVTPDAPHLQPGKNPNSSWVLGYGYQWWIPQNPEGDFLAIGIYNQFIYIHPGLKVVIAKTSAYADYNKDGSEKEIETIEIFRHIARNIN